MDRVIPEVGHVFYRTRISDEKAGTFKIVWQQVERGQQVGYVDEAMTPYTPPALHDAQPLDATPYFLPGIMNDPDPADTARIRAERQAAIDAEVARLAAEAAAAEATAAALAAAAASPPGGDGQDSVAGG